MQSKDDVLNFLLDFLSQEMPATVVKTWFEDAKIADITQSEVIFETTAEFKKNIITSRYSSILQKALYELFGQNFNIRVVLPTDKKIDTVTYDRRSFVFETFVVGESNKFAEAAARAVSEAPGTVYNPLFIYGGSGLGKTHLLYAIMNSVRSKHPEFLIRDFSAELFTNDLVHAIQTKTNHDFHQKYRMADILLVDDIQFISGRNFSQEEFFHTFNSVFDDGHQIVITSDRPPKDIKSLEERLRTRFEWGLIIDIQSPDFETRVAIVQSKARRLGLLLPDEIVNYIAQTVTSNVRQLEGTVKKLLAYRELLNDSMNIEKVQNAVNDILKLSPGLNPTPELIINEVCLFYNITEKEILGKGRRSNIVAARQIAMYLIRHLTEISFKESGDKIFKRDHTTIMYAFDKIEENRTKNPALDNDINTIIENIRSR